MVLAVADQDERPDLEVEAVPRRRHLLVAAVAAALIGVDQLTKWWAHSRLADGHTVDLIGSLKLKLAFNSGAAFSIGSDSNVGPLIALLAIVVVGVLVATGATTRFVSGAIAVGLIAGGALGNLIDRAFRTGSGFMGGHVVDFIYLSWWPTFNLADAGICVGAVLLLVSMIRHPTA